MSAISKTLQQALVEADTAYSVLALDPSLLGSKSVTRAMGSLMQIKKSLRLSLSELVKSPSADKDSKPL